MTVRFPRTICIGSFVFHFGPEPLSLGLMSYRPADEPGDAKGFFIEKRLDLGPRGRLGDYVLDHGLHRLPVGDEPIGAPVYARQINANVDRERARSRKSDFRQLLLVHRLALAARSAARSVRESLRISKERGR